MANTEGENQTPHDPQGEQPTGQTPEENLGAADIAQMHEEVAHYKDQFLRTVAEMDNLRRRLEKEKADAIKFALENFFHELLPVLDSFDRAIPDQNGGEAQDADAGFKSGINMVKKQLFQVLSKHGLEAVQSIGQPFDPNVHQAIQKIESDTAKQEMVGSEFARGYLLRGRLVRPAMVSVLSPKA